MRRLKILEMKEIESENYSHYVKYEDRLFWFKPRIFEAFRHKTEHIYQFSSKTNYKCWYLKNSGCSFDDLSIFLDQHLSQEQNEERIKVIKKELKEIVV